MMQRDLALEAYEVEEVLNPMLGGPEFSACQVFLAALLRVRSNLPGFVWRDDVEREPGSAVGLVEAGKPSVAEVRFQVGVEVQVVICKVFKLVEASTVVHIRVLELEAHLILLARH